MALDPATASAAPPTTGACSNSNILRQVCQFTNPQDLAVVPESRWLLVSQISPSGSESGFAAIDTSDLRVVKIDNRDIGMEKLDKAAACVGQPHHYILGGISIRYEHGRYRLAAVQHEDNGRDAVAFFNVLVKPEGIKLSWDGCVLAPEPLFLNDVAILPDGGFAATHMFDRALAAEDKKRQRQRYLDGENTGYLVKWSSTGGWKKIPNSDGSFLNGIVATADGKELYMAETYGHRVNSIAIDGSNRHSISLRMQPDKVKILSVGRIVVAGGTGAPVTSTAGCAKLRPQSCGFPSEVDEVNFKNSSVKKLFADTGSQVPGASVGLVVKSNLFVGTAFGNRLTVVSLPDAVP